MPRRPAGRPLLPGEPPGPERPFDGQPATTVDAGGERLPAGTSSMAALAASETAETAETAELAELSHESPTKQSVEITASLAAHEAAMARLRFGVDEDDPSAAASADAFAENLPTRVLSPTPPQLRPPRVAPPAAELETPEPPAARAGAGRLEGRPSPPLARPAWPELRVVPPAPAPGNAARPLLPALLVLAGLVTAALVVWIYVLELPLELPARLFGPPPDPTIAAPPAPAPAAIAPPGDSDLPAGLPPGDLGGAAPPSAGLALPAAAPIPAIDPTSSTPPGPARRSPEPRPRPRPRPPSEPTAPELVSPF